MNNKEDRNDEMGVHWPERKIALSTADRFDDERFFDLGTEQSPTRKTENSTPLPPLA